VLDEDCEDLPSIRAERGPGNRSWVRSSTRTILEKLFSDPEIRQAKGLFITPFKAQAKNIASYYAENLVDSEELRVKYFSIIEREYQMTKTAILQISQQDELLDETLYLRKSIELRNPYVDPLSYLQVQFLKKVRAQGDDERKSLLDYVLMSITGVASGLQSTG
ncbi:MAG: phosphoenolpyruvate carboxylase, partial [Leptolyngbya sp.]|nr:phosphoenolpyruvate carboxylase [Candidatus Melainabacteria bacterium]